MKDLSFILLLLSGCISVSLFLWLRVGRGGIPGVISKAAASLFFVLTGISASFFSPDNLFAKAATVIGLIFGMLGDIWLDLKATYPKDVKPWLYSGFISFMLGHVFYIISIVSVSNMQPKYTALAIISAVALGKATISLEKLMKLDYGSYKNISFIYASLLICTSITSLIACLGTGSKSSVLLFIGSLFFLISDLILSNTYFGIKSKNEPIWIISNHVTYYAAQYLIAVSIAFL